MAHDRLDPDLSNESSIVVLMCVDALLFQRPASSHPATRQMTRQLENRRIPIVLVSDRSVAELRAAQHTLGIVAPVIARGGGALCVPPGLDSPLAGFSSTDDDWRVMEFAPPAIAEAIEIVSSLYDRSGAPPFLVAVGTSTADRVVFQHVHGRVVVRQDVVEQTWLRAEFPDAHITSSSGLDGVAEALLSVTLATADDDSPDGHGADT